MYEPDGWNIIKLISTESTYFRVFGTWLGGYLGSDSWRLNSGITKVIERDLYYDFKGASGSLYRCYKNREGLGSNYSRGVLESIKNTTDVKVTNSTVEEVIGAL